VVLVGKSRGHSCGRSPLRPSRRAIRPSTARATRARPCHFSLVEAHHEDAKSLWEDRFEKTDGWWRGHRHRNRSLPRLCVAAFFEEQRRSFRWRAAQRSREPDVLGRRLLTCSAFDEVRL
jgi:hypothetical protein